MKYLLFLSLFLTACGPPAPVVAEPAKSSLPAPNFSFESDWQQMGSSSEFCVIVDKLTGNRYIYATRSGGGICITKLDK